MSRVTAEQEKQMQDAEELLFTGPEKLSVGKGLFLGRFIDDWVMPFPTIDPEKRAEVEEVLARLRLFLDQHLPIPNQMVPPRSRGGGWMAVDDREIDPFRLASPELILQFPLRIRPGGKYDKTRSISIDAVDDERSPLSA